MITEIRYFNTIQPAYAGCSDLYFMPKFCVLAFIFIFSLNSLAQSGRVAPNTAESTTNELNNLTSEQMFNEASNYIKVKIAEFERQKIPPNTELFNKTVLEQKQLAAKYAAQISTRENLSTDDFYYLGMLHSLAENADGAGEALRKFLATENPNAEKAQTARSVLVTVAARQKKFDEAEKLLAEYLKNEPLKTSERALMASELMESYKAEKNYAKAAVHAEEVYRTAKLLFTTWSSRVRALNEVLGAGMNVFELYRTENNQPQADKILDDLRKTGVLIESNSVYFAAIDRKIKYLIETGRKPLALQFYADALGQIKKDFTSIPLQEDIARSLRKREAHYKILGETARELTDIEKWFPEQPVTFSNLRGKVVLLDFWATWCAPCIESFPSLIDLHKKYQKDGLVILGITRFYGEVQGDDADEVAEIEYLQNFRKTHNLPYDFVVAKGQANQIVYGATGIPTAVLIDRKGIVRYVEAGSGTSRELQIQKEIEKLLAEK